jgi:hypothetical protein
MYHNIVKDGRIEVRTKLGHFVVRCVSDPRPIKDMWVRDAPEEALISLDTAERFTVVSQNIHFQVCFGKNLRDPIAIVAHSSSDQVSWVVIEELECGVPDAHAYIAETNRRDSGYYQRAFGLG